MSEFKCEHCKQEGGYPCKFIKDGKPMQICQQCWNALKLEEIELKKNPPKTLEEMTVKELKKKLIDLEVNFTNSMKKPELIELVKKSKKGE